MGFSVLFSLYLAISNILFIVFSPPPVVSDLCLKDSRYHTLRQLLYIYNYSIFTSCACYYSCHNFIWLFLLNRPTVFWDLCGFLCSQFCLSSMRITSSPESFFLHNSLLFHMVMTILHTKYSNSDSLEDLLLSQFLIVKSDYLTLLLFFISYV